ncbi:cation diffusion facilitator family transporter [Sporolactobacillus sp. CQH2019]|uniref:cation diffusion facilitator family transporter n=1 Tax=Sporolactobacillus sp. CQH2019 TaxID=3023512 RepID=UPI0023677DEE|nr:cation diffusion facilitator family transporter [Sporolactobacillus sp. CQH2019]MDD9148599.1 cation diffusion facilitator family transporter [Sporolactobacillus sp. CQH2019]
MKTAHTEDSVAHNHEILHAHDHSANKKALLAGFLLITGFMVIEIIGGLLSRSLALLSDAGHMLSDSISLGLSLIALIVGSQVPADNNKTFGYRRFEILTALFNGILLLIISVWIIYEAILRLRHPVEVAGSGMLIVAFAGLVVNLAVARILMHGETEENLNVKSAFVHVLGDLFGSVGAIAAALLIGFFGWEIADPIASVVVSLIIVRSGWQVTRASINILMESRPDNLNVEEIRSRIMEVDGIRGIHDLHVWTITSGFLSLSCHLTVDKRADRDEMLRKVERVLESYNLGHSTIQIEGTDFSDCHTDCAGGKQQTHA